MPDQAFQLSAPNVPLRASAKASAVPAPGLPNHTPLGPITDRELAACRRNGTSLAVLAIGLSGLESVAHCHGRAVENQLLHAVWQRLRNHLRGSDVAVHVGDREFGAILLNATGSTAALVDARLSEALSQPYGIGELEIVISARIGVAVYPQAGTTGEALAAAAAQNVIAKR
jgi:diguanylate cyclase (GGDEF)-like protein